MSWIAAGVTAASAIGGAISANQKSTQASRLAGKEQALLEQQRNYISPALIQALGNSEKRMNSTMYAGQDIDQANLDRNSNQAFNNVTRGTTSPTNVVNAAMAIQGNKNIAEQGLQRNLAQYKDKANQDFTSLLLQKANAQTQQKHYNDQIQGAIWQNQAESKNADADMWASLLGGGLKTGGLLASKSGGAASPTSNVNPYMNPYNYWTGGNGDSNAGNV